LDLDIVIFDHGRRPDPLAKRIGGYQLAVGLDQRRKDFKRTRPNFDRFLAGE
jgi:hypothetical protein